jgi:ribosomal protein S18 acetylase RimI-like enzyme
MRIKRGTSEEMLILWDGRFESFVEDHVSKIDSGIQEVWLMEDEEAGKFIGELHILWDSEDKDQANGVDTAYILAFRIDPAYQGRKLGTQLMRRVLERIKEKSFTKATIGADDYDPKLKVMYENWGFVKQIKECSFEYMYEGEKVVSTYVLLGNDRL